MNGGSSGGQRVQPSAPEAGAQEAGVLDVRGVTVRFGGITALDDVSLTAAPRQVTGIIGPNGAGKTTLLNVLCGLVRPESGQIRFDGRELARLRPHRLASLGIARTLQGVGLFNGLSAVENVMVGATCHSRAGFWSGLFGLPWSDRDERALRKRAMEALELVDAADLADSPPATLAYGLRKRIALARALVARPRLLLLDEPASGLSESELPEIGDLIEKLAADACVVVIEHRMDLMMSVCDTITVLDFGKVIAGGTPHEVQADPAVTAAYLGVEVAKSGRAGDEAAPAGPGQDAAPAGPATRAAREARPMSDAAALAVEDVVAGYGGAPVLDGISIMIRPATITAVLGANGAGKTTLLRTITGLVRPRRGRIAVDGVNLARRPPEAVARAGVAHVPEGQGVITELTVEENLRLGALLRTGRKGRASRAGALADSYRRFPVLAERRRQAAGTLSGGERQILVIARALMAQPRVLLLDEPSLGLAPRIVAQVMDLVRELRDDSGLTVLLVEQNARSALSIANRGIVLNLGKVVADADAAELLTDVGLRRHYLGF